MKKVIALTLCAVSFGFAAHAAPQSKGAKKPVKMSKVQMQKMRAARLAKIKKTSSVKAKVISATPPASCCAHSGMTDE